MKEFKKIDWSKYPPIEEYTDLGSDTNHFDEEICVIEKGNDEKAQGIDKFDKI